jgi:CheY-like chemotaxis protein
MAAATSHDTAEILAGARVLVVDDHSFTIGLLKDVLYACGATSVHSARDGAEAIEMLRVCHPQLVVTDWRMPVLDGMAFTEAVRRAAINGDRRIPDPEVPIVLLSAHASVKTVEQARRAGVNEVVVKPFTIAGLVQRLKAAMRNPREFVVSEAYVGPDRRRRTGGAGARRRAVDVAPEATAPPVASSPFKRLKKEIDGVEQGRRRAVKALPAS